MLADSLILPALKRSKLFPLCIPPCCENCRGLQEKSNDDVLAYEQVEMEIEGDLPEYGTKE